MKEKKQRVKKPFFKSPLKIILAIVALLVVAVAVTVAVAYLSSVLRTHRQLSQYEAMTVLENMDSSSFATSGEGYTFTSTDAAGNPIRFYGEGISLTEGGIAFSPGGFLCSLDAVGSIGIYGVDLMEASDPETLFDWGGGYTFSAEKTSVDSVDELLRLDGFGVYAHSYAEPGYAEVEEELHPNFVYVANGSSAEYGGGDLVLEELTVYYGEEKNTPIGSVEFNTDFYHYYLENTPYDLAVEGKVDREKNIFDFYLMVAPDNGVDYHEVFMDIGFYPITCPDKDQFTIGALRDSAGNEVDKATAMVSVGMTLDITIGDTTVAVELPVVPRFSNATMLSELAPYTYAESLGEAQVLAVPVCWSDEPDRANDEALDLYRRNLGRVAAVGGSVEDYSDSDDGELSISEYFDLISYGKYTVNTVLTDWYMIDEAFADNCYSTPDVEYGAKVLAWVKETYPDLDWTEFDRDSDGYVDNLLIINAGYVDPESGYDVASMSGALLFRERYDGSKANTPEDPTLNTYLSVNQMFLELDNARTLIHELSHNFGIIDYYDVTYSGINTVGGYDMESDNHGDWNAFSKYAVGWLEPEVVTGLDSGESVEITIGASALTDDAIVIPAASSRFYDGTPFSEYILIDLFTAKGAHQVDAALYGLQDATGVRIYHVDALMELHVEEEMGKSYDVGTPHYVNAYNDDGQYQLELIQSGGGNTFTDLNNLNPIVSAEDFFYSGDTFRVEDYDEFFTGGLMDEGVPFGYTVEVVSITAGETPTATIRITAQ